MLSLTDSQREKSGTHEPVWIPLEELRGLDIRPRALGDLLAILRATRDTVVAARLRPPND